MTTVSGKEEMHVEGTEAGSASITPQDPAETDLGGYAGIKNGLTASSNPFSISTTIRFHVTVAGPVTVSIYDTRGALVRTLKDGVLSAGPHELVWDGRDAGGKEVVAGTYFVRFTAGRRSGTHKLMLVK